MTDDMKSILMLVLVLVIAFFLICLSASYFGRTATKSTTVTCPKCNEQFIILNTP